MDPILYFRPTDQDDLEIRPRDEQAALLVSPSLSTGHTRLIRVYRAARRRLVRHLKALAA